MQSGSSRALPVAADPGVQMFDLNAASRADLFQDVAAFHRWAPRAQPVLRKPAATPLIDRWMPRCSRSFSGAPSLRLR